jgi:HEAT repeat protein
MSTNALPGLKKYLHAEDTALKVTVVRILRRYGFVRVRVLMARDWRTRAALACGALGPLGCPAIPDLLEMCKSDPLSYNVPASAIGQMGENAVEPLAVALINPDRNVRRVAAVALGYIGPPARAAVPALIKCLQDEDIDVCVNASQALGVIGIGSPEVVKTLIEALAHPDSIVRCNAAGSLATLGKGAEAAVPALLKLLDDTDEVVRSDATNALQRISPESAAKAGVK